MSQFVILITGNESCNFRKYGKKLTNSLMVTLTLPVGKGSENEL